MRSRQRIVAVSAAAALAVAACSGSGDDSAPGAATTEPVAATTVTDEVVDPAGGSEPSPSGTDAPPRIADGPLADVCPSTITIQTGGLPSPAVGPIYLLLGPNATIDDTGSIASGALTRPDGAVEDVTLEIRSGGPSVGFRQAIALLADDESVTLAQVSTAQAAIAYDSTPTVAVVSLTETTHEAIVWDPQSYPSIDDLDGIRRARVEVRHVTDSPAAAFLVATEAISGDQVEPGFDRTPVAFVASGGTIAQLGDALIDPALFASLPQWGRPVATASIVAAGWDAYDDTLVVRADDVETARDCFGRLVPVIQAAIVAYTTDPSTTNQLMTGMRDRVDPLTPLTPDQMDVAVAEGVAGGVFANSPDGSVGSFDSVRLDSFGPELAEALDLDPVEAADLVTNDFIDPAIGI